MTERLGAYLAVILSAHYHNHRYSSLYLNPNRDVLYEDLIGTTNRVEQALRRQMPALQRSMSDVLPQSVVDSLDQSEPLTDDELFSEE